MKIKVENSKTAGLYTRFWWCLKIN